MPRLKVINPETDTGPGADLINRLPEQKRLNIFKSMANNAGVAKAFMQFSQGVKAGALTDAEHEIIALTVAQKSGCDYCLAAHTKMAEAAGINNDLAIQIRQGTADNDRHQALLDFTSAILKNDGWVSDEQLEAFREAGYDDDAVVEVIGEIAVMTFTNLFNHVNHTEIDMPEVAAV